MKTARNWISAALVALALLSLGACLDAPANEAQDVSDDVRQAVTMAQVVAARDALALRLCAAEMGAGATVLWTHEGDMVCRPGANQVAKGGQ